MDDEIVNSAPAGVIRSPASLTATFTGGALMVSAILQPNRITTLSLCPIFHLTGIECPFCGMTRSFVSITHGDFAQAIDYNPGSPLIYAAFVWIFLVSLKDMATKQFENFPRIPRWLMQSWLLITCSIFAWLFWERMIVYASVTMHFNACISICI